MTRDEGTGAPQPLEVNGRLYAWPARPVVGVCFDGCDPAYLAAAGAAGAIPALDRMRRAGFAARALAAMPTFTNPNNVSIICGAPPEVHGVSGNFYLDRATGAEVMMVDAAPVRAPSILSAFSQAGAKVAAVTAKDKLRKALGKGVAGMGPSGKSLRGIAFSAEKADVTSQGENGISGVCDLVGRGVPDPYSADLSLFVLDAGIRLLETARPDISYLSLSDYVQHKHAPEAPEAIAFMAEVDRRLARLVALGACVGIVADHGMSDMARPDGTPDVTYLGDLLDAAFGPGATRVICPITDPFVRHHGALGGFVRVHILRPDVAREAVLAAVHRAPGVALAAPREEACLRFALPEDREGDIAVVARKGTALGDHARDHDLSQLAGTRLRSHGGLEEQVVPFIVSHPLKPEPAGATPRRLRNYDLFSVLLNDVEAG